MAKNDIPAVNEFFRKELADAEGHRENPRIISVLRGLIRMTNTDDQNKDDDSATEQAAAAQQAAEKKKAETCPHEIVNRKTGRCVACGEVL